MITLCRAKGRRHRREQEGWPTFYSRDSDDPLAGGFGALEILNEDRLPPGESFQRQMRQDAEIITYVREGVLVYEDSMGCSGFLQAGEFQCMTTGHGIPHSEMNASQANWAQVFQLGLRTSPGIEVAREQKRFSVAQRRGVLCVVASPDARAGSLCIQQDALLHSAVLEPGQHVVHELAQGRSAWLHLVQGEVALGDVVLSTGDGAGVAAERAVSFTARKNTEILLLDLGEKAGQQNE